MTRPPLPRSFAALAVLLALAGCFTAEPAPTRVNHDPPPDDPAGEPNDARWRDALRTIARDYPSWGRVDDEARWAPFLCRMPEPARARLSQSDDLVTHGRKLYTLYALDAAAYGAPASGDHRGSLPFAQVLVKEAWVPEVVDAARESSRETWGRSRLRPVTADDGQVYGGDRLSGLFIVAQLADDQDTAGTDEGWVYATLQPDGQRTDAEPAPGRALNDAPPAWSITAAGPIASCMGCHQTLGAGRLFGLEPR